MIKQAPIRHCSSPKNKESNQHPKGRQMSMHLRKTQVFICPKLMIFAKTNVGPGFMEKGIALPHPPKLVQSHDVLPLLL